jgi:hypothetical protein
MNAHTPITLNDIAFDVETYLTRVRSLVRAIMMLSEEITNDERDSLMLTDLTFEIGDQLDAIAKVLGLPAA